MHSEPKGPPSRAKLYGEALGGLQFIRLGAHSRRLAKGPMGNGELVITSPGMGAGDLSMAPMRQYLTSRRMVPHGWGLGTNTGMMVGFMPQFVQMLEQRVAEHGQLAHLVGWSAGGMISREAARAYPHLVAQVISIGSPIVGGPLYTNVAPAFDDATKAQILERLRLRERTPITVPVTAIYSKADGVADWRACMDHKTPHADNVEVRSTHGGLGIDPDVWLVVARKIAGFAGNHATT